MRIADRFIQKEGITPFLVAYMAIAVSGTDVLAQAVSNGFARTVNAIKDYDRPAIIRAGNSGNPDYIPYLRSIVLSTPAYRGPAEEEAVIALAKLGERRSQREFECDLLTNDPNTVEGLGSKVLPKIKGWFAIRAYFFMLQLSARHCPRCFVSADQKAR